VYQRGSLLDGLAMYLSCDTKKFHDNKAHTYYVLFGRPPIEGKLPPSPPGGATAEHGAMRYSWCRRSSMTIKHTHITYFLDVHPYWGSFPPSPLAAPLIRNEITSLSPCVCLQLYRLHGNVVHLAMSADASCRGLISPTDGPVRIELTEGKTMSII